MIALTAMTIQIIDNNPDGIRICRVDGESLVTVVVPRDMLSEAKSLPDLPDRGVYYLLDEEIRGCGHFLGDNHAAIPWL